MPTSWSTTPAAGHRYRDPGDHAATRPPDRDAITPDCGDIRADRDPRPVQRHLRRHDARRARRRRARSRLASGAAGAPRLDGVTVRIHEVVRGGDRLPRRSTSTFRRSRTARHLRDIRALVEAADVPATVAVRADRVVHGHRRSRGGDSRHAVRSRCICTRWGRWTRSSTSSARSGASSCWGSTRVYCGTLTLGDGFVKAAHGVLPVPAPATMKLLEGLAVRPGPEGAGELVTPTGAALVRELSAGPPPAEYRPIRSGFGAGTRDSPTAPTRCACPGRGIGGRCYRRRATESLLLLASDVDDMTGEELAVLTADCAKPARSTSCSVPVQMKKGRPGVRVEALCRPT